MVMINARDVHSIDRSRIPFVRHDFLKSNLMFVNSKIHLTHLIFREDVFFPSVKLVIIRYFILAKIFEVVFI